MITSPHNEKLKLIRKLSERKHRERESLFATEGEDLVAAGLAAGRDPLFALVAPESGIDGEEVEADLLDGVSTLGSGTRAIAVWRQAWVEPGPGPCAYLHGVADPGNVGAVVRTVDALAGGTVTLGPGCADPHSPKAVRASMGSIFGVGLARASLERDAGAPRCPDRPWRGGSLRSACDALPGLRARRAARGRGRRVRRALDDPAAGRWRRVAERGRRGGDRVT